MAAYRQQYEQWAEGQLGEIRRHNAAITAMTTGLRNGDPEAAVEYFSAALYASTGWPEGLPRQVSAAYDAGARRLVLELGAARYDVVPEAKSARYMINADQVKDSPRPVTQRRTLYRDVLAQMSSCWCCVISSPPMSSGRWNRSR
ncbi:Restriction system protein OS=Streptomyces microflavus OX=1919 GN=Smic_32160 PE=4 SV=1 [Streptomyces microflavus]